MTNRIAGVALLASLTLSTACSSTTEITSDDLEQRSAPERGELSVDVPTTLPDAAPKAATHSEAPRSISASNPTASAAMAATATGGAATTADDRTVDEPPIEVTAGAPTSTSTPETPVSPAVADATALATSPAAASPSKVDLAPGTPHASSAPAPAAPISTPQAPVLATPLTPVQLDLFSVAVPSDWMILRHPAEVQTLVAHIGDNSWVRNAVLEFEGMLGTGQAAMAINMLGDNVNAFRQPGPASALAQPELIASFMADTFEAAGAPANFTGEARTMGGRDGVVVSGTYEINGLAASMHQFATHHDGHLYYVTVTFMSADDPWLANDIFSSVHLG